MQKRRPTAARKKKRGRLRRNPAAAAAVSDLEPRLVEVVKRVAASSACVEWFPLTGVCVSFRNGLRAGLGNAPTPFFANFGHSLDYVQFTGPSSTWELETLQNILVGGICFNCWDGATLEELPFDFGKHPAFLFLTKIRFSCCQKLVDVSSLRRRAPFLRSVELCGCPLLRSLAGLEAVRTVELDACRSVTDLGPLRAAKAVYVFDMPHVEDVSPLSGVPAVWLWNALRVQTVAPLARVHSLCLGGRVFPKDLPLLVDRVYRLELNCCDERISLAFPQALGNVRVLKLASLPGLETTTLPALKSVRAVELYNLKQLTDVSWVARAETVYLKQCPVDDLAPLVRAKKIVVKECPTLETRDGLPANVVFE